MSDNTDPLDPASAGHVDRRDFLKAAAGTAVVLGQTPPLFPATGVQKPKKRAGSPTHVVVIGAGAWGGWTAWHLRKAGVKVTVVDQYGPANSRATSADETRGIRSSYGDRAGDAGPHWTAWARSAIGRWKEFDAEWGPVFRTRFFMTTGDVICRAAEEPFTTRTREIWLAQNVKHELLTGDEVRKRFPMMNNDDTKFALYEPDAGVARARASTLAVAAIAEKAGVEFRIGRIKPGPIVNNQMDGVVFDDGSVLRGDAYVFCCGAWLRKLFPTLMTNRMRVPLGYVGYFGTPIGDNRFTYPNMPSYNFPGVTGWAALPVDYRGFRVRGGIAAPAPAASAPAAPGTAAPAPAAPVAPAAPAPAAPIDPTLADPDLSSRQMTQPRLDSSRRFVARRFPLLADAPLLETRACHYESSVNSNFIIDHLPGADNAWIAGVGQAEGFKFGPVAGEYVAMRVL
ncbi:MAG: FAD-dependent oxidoreductase, partial [Gemmatimonadetes bacterium]|nr:FAD-dependent oxidoreductase [Gemmatimonadota bacterium]